jgi:hypothetical protein
MRKLTASILLLLPLAIFGQNVQMANPPNAQMINPPAQFVMNTDDMNNYNEPVNVTNESKNKQVQQKRPVNWIGGNVFNNDNTDQGYNPSRKKYGQCIQIPSGYSGSSGLSSHTKHKSRTDYELKFKKAFKIFEHKYTQPDHYGHKGKVRKCSQF